MTESHPSGPGPELPPPKRHRGPHPQDRKLFAPAEMEKLRTATEELSWLLGRRYALPSALKVAGDRHQLRLRQRQAVMRCACAPEAAARRRRHEVATIEGGTILLDGYNVLTIVESALGGAVVLRGRDRCLRDLGGVHGTFRRVHETAPALRAIGARLARLGAESVRWKLDRPVSNSGRLRALILATAAAEGWPWTVELSDSPDRLLAAATEVIATADSVILDRCARWYPLAGEVIAEAAPGAWIADLGVDPAPGIVRDLGPGDPL